LGDTYSGLGEDLLFKMILAMNFEKDTIKRIPFDENIDTRLELNKTITQYRPQIVVSMGAVVTNLLLERKEKLSSIHGQHIPMETSDWKYLLVPIFHPEFLMINPNMKRTAWNDLQKIMEYFKKES
jgi:DNA polymerase